MRHQAVNWRRSSAYASRVSPRYPVRNPASASRSASVKTGRIVARAVDGVAVVIGNLPAGLRPWRLGQLRVPAIERKPNVKPRQPGHATSHQAEPERSWLSRETLQIADSLPDGRLWFVPARRCRSSGYVPGCWSSMVRCRRPETRALSRAVLDVEGYRVRVWRASAGFRSRSRNASARSGRPVQAPMCSRARSLAGRRGGPFVVDDGQRAVVDEPVARGPTHGDMGP